MAHDMDPKEHGANVAPNSECPLCGSGDCEFLFQLEQDHVLSCTTCEMVYSVSSPFDKMQVYTAAYFSGEVGGQGYQDYESELRSHSATFSKRLRACEKRLGSKGRLLDYGCAVGHLAKTAQDQGWQVFATDLSYYAVEKARQDFGINGFVSDLTAPPLKRNQFDLITLYDVIEHMPEPHQILQGLAALLKERGLLHVTTPNVTSLSALVMGRSWYHFKAQEHLLYFSPKTLRRVLREHGFRVHETSVAPSYMTVHDVFVRLKRYSDLFSSLALQLLKAFKLQNVIVRLHTGELQCFASPLAAFPAKSIERVRSERYRLAVESMPVLEVVCCPACSGDLEPTENLTQLVCLDCQASYEVRGGIPILLKNGQNANLSESA